MLDYYKDKQPTAYNIMINEINNHQLSHAYLIDENNNLEAFSIVKSFVKEILCSYLDDNEKKRQLIKRIDDDNYQELKIIEPDGMLIKKRQILDLQQEFSMSAIEGNKRIYIIRDADKMRSETANSMLKFLEEPDNDIIAILMTNNFNNVLPTIVSRCQVIKFVNDSAREDNNELNDLVITFINEIENEGLRSIIMIQESILSVIQPKERDKFEVFFDKLIDKYYLAIEIDVKNMSNLEEVVKVIREKNTHREILEKINCLINAKDAVKYNVNTSLLLDSVIVNLGGRK